MARGGVELRPFDAGAAPTIAAHCEDVGGTWIDGVNKDRRTVRGNVAASWGRGSPRRCQALSASGVY